jgi:hypothetical protein
MSLESAGGRLVPDKAQRSWMIAQAHIADRDGLLELAAKEAELAGEDYIKPAVEFLGAKETYEETIAKLKKHDPTANNMADFFLQEKSLNIQAVSSPLSLDMF